MQNLSHLSKELIILSDNFGTSFSGGCTATANFTRYWKNSFDKIHVVCKQTDGFLKDDIVVWDYDDQISLDKILFDLAKRPTIGYGDFHTAKHLIQHNIPFYFTYHDNYPELKDINPFSLEATKMMDTYAKVFSNAEFVFSVSEYKLKYIKKYTNRCTLIRNGISQPQTKSEFQELNRDGLFKILMAGNFSTRKYEKALLLFDRIEEEQVKNIQIDVFGSTINEKISRQLEEYSFVKKKMFEKVISYHGYHAYLNTSLVENLSLSVVDSIANYTPVVSFDVGGIAEIIDKSNGVIIPKYDIEAMLKSILKMKNGRMFEFDKTKIRDFDWAISAEKMYRIMNKSRAAV